MYLLTPNDCSGHEWIQFSVFVFFRLIMYAPYRTNHFKSHQGAVTSDSLQTSLSHSRFQCVAHRDGEFQKYSGIGRFHFYLCFAGLYFSDISWHTFIRFSANKPLLASPLYFLSNINVSLFPFLSCSLINMY